jgi:hypothetical protein
MALLVAMSLADFRDMPHRIVPRTTRSKDPSLTGRDAMNWMMIGYFGKFIRHNKPLMELHQRCDFDDPGFMGRLTEGQRMLMHLYALDGHTCDGGITQFVWHAPDMVLTAVDALETLGYSDLQAAYRTVISQWESHADAWANLRNQERSLDEDLRDDFIDALHLINPDAFDDRYVHHFGANARMMAVQYINANPHEFITEIV